jgi:aminopeptidase N
MKYFNLIVLAFSLHAQAHIHFYKVEITPDFKNKTITAVQTLQLGYADTLTFSTEDLVIDSIKAGKKNIKFTLTDGKVSFSATDKQKNIVIHYHGTEPKGLVFGSEYVYSNFNTCNWMLCHIEPENRAPSEISVVVPSAYKVTASGNFASQEPYKKKLTKHTFREDETYSTYLFGFAAGKFFEAQGASGKTQLRYLGVADDEKSLQAKFKDTADMMQFFEQKSGVSYPHGTYTQVLVPEDEAQEKNNFSLIGKDSLDPILLMPQEDWVIAHELSHQWWGNLLTCKTWADFWLNEGVTVFMVAAYKEQKWGKAAYDHELELAQKRYQRALDEKFDVPLSFAGEYPSMRIKRAIVYNKGALFMAALRKELGDEKFWAGLKKYTQDHQYKAVVSADFQTSFEASSGQKLDTLFKKWVY